MAGLQVQATGALPDAIVNSADLPLCNAMLAVPIGGAQPGHVAVSRNAGPGSSLGRRSPALSFVHHPRVQPGPRTRALAAGKSERAAMALLSPGRYVLASIVVAAAVVWHAFSTRQQ